MISGVLILDKPVGETSSGFSRKVGRLLKTEKVGHTGTLDPFASGVLPIVLGEATKISAYLTAQDKVYEAVIALGVATDTLDIDGTVVAQSPIPADLTREKILQAIQTFCGEILQTPPAYSAKKIDGKRSYDLARQGIVVALPAVPVKIFEFVLMDYRPPHLSVRLHASKGTYVRCLAADLAVKLGTHGHLHSLKRIRHGSFELKQAVSWTQLLEMAEKSPESLNQFLKEKLLSPGRALGDLPEYCISPNGVNHVLQGRDPNVLGLRESRPTAMGPQKWVDEAGRLIALVEARESPIIPGKIHYQYLRVFVDLGPAVVGMKNVHS